ncbi:hypothetical protein K7X08_002749 [Anisodus acutangulus]|uniref:Uncharacterized protein n=1 Tax=Anisodus acutangulus TaxID=402998 RepID=A0A9Q1MG59_9SOLA|nr:hypothetical protein K7X08_002749 [Anisodus acutangulus]
MRAMAWNWILDSFLFEGDNGTPLPKFNFLTETKNRDRTVKRVQRQLNMAHAIIVEPVGLSGGALFWNDDIKMQDCILMIEGQVLVLRLWIALGNCFMSMDPQFNMLGMP